MTQFSLKDHLFNKTTVSYLADLFSVVHSSFNKTLFVSEVVGMFPELELKARIGWIAEVLARYLPSDPKAAMNVIVKALPRPLDLTKTDDDFGSFILAPLGEYIVRHGCTKKNLNQSLRTLREITMRFSMEDAMRTFLNDFPVETLAAYDVWVSDKNYHVRRLVSESTRPSLPWSQKISIDYAVPVKYLDVLHADSTRYVTRSVANHLNDISKKDSELVVALLRGWTKEQLQNDKELAWMKKHALRTLVKQGNQSALQLLGYGVVKGVRVEDFAFSFSHEGISRGETFQFSFSVLVQSDAELLIDYIIDFVKVSGITKPKVFKIKKVSAQAGAPIILTQKHYLKADATTFKLHPGLHTLTIQINGQKLVSAPFRLN